MQEEAVGRGKGNFQLFLKINLFLKNAAPTAADIQSFGQIWSGDLF